MMEEIIKDLIDNCKFLNAAKTSVKSKRTDGYEVEIVVRKEGTVAFDEFDTAQLNAIRDIFVSDIKNGSHLMCADMALEIINVCQARLDAPEYYDIQDIIKEREVRK